MVELSIAVIGCIGTVIGSSLGVIASASKTNFRLAQLEKGVEELRGLLSRLVVVEQRSKSNAHRLDDLRRELE